MQHLASLSRPLSEPPTKGSTPFTSPVACGCLLHRKSKHLISSELRLEPTNSFGSRPFIYLVYPRNGPLILAEMWFMPNFDHVENYTIALWWIASKVGKFEVYNGILKVEISASGFVQCHGDRNADVHGDGNDIAMPNEYVQEVR
jgi:hypothetical protein